MAETVYTLTSKEIEELGFEENMALEATIRQVSLHVDFVVDTEKCLRASNRDVSRR